MKNLFALIICVFMTIGVSAQTEQGSVMVGGSLTLDLAFDSDDDVFLFSFNPTYAKFVRNNFAFGGTVGVEYDKKGELKETNFSLGPLARWYVLGSSDLRMFLQGQVEYISSKSDNGFSDPVKTNGFGVFAGPGISYFLTDAVSVDIILGYNYEDYGDDISSSNLRLAAGLQIFL